MPARSIRLPCLRSKVCGLSLCAVSDMQNLPQITKDGSKDNPAVVVEGGSRNPVVKRASELNKQDDE